VPDRLSFADVEVDALALDPRCGRARGSVCFTDFVAAMPTIRVIKILAYGLLWLLAAGVIGWALDLTAAGMIFVLVAVALVAVVTGMWLFEQIDRMK
jgi:hypothetical protein